MREATRTGGLTYLLVMPRLIRSLGDGYSFPLGIAYISASMKKAGYHVETINLNHRDGGVAAILAKEIADKKIDVVATGGLSFQYSTVRAVVEAAKQAKPDVITVVGGGLISGDPEAAMQALQCADYGVIGEGEATICELGHLLEHGGEESKVSGLIYRNGNEYIRTPPRKEIENIDDLAWPDYDGFDIETYLQSNPPGISGLNKGRTLFMLASRSCPFNCTFCFHTAGRKYRQRSLDSFFAELDHVVKKYKLQHVCMADELFARDLPRVREFCERIRKYSLTWWAQFRVDDVTPEILATLKYGNCTTMSFGLESADNKILRSMRKGTTVEQIEHALKLVYDSGINLEGCFIFGDIEETMETACNTLNWWRAHTEYKINLNLITVFPGCHLYHYACQHGIIKNRVRFLQEGCPQVNVSKLTGQEMSDLARTVMEAQVGLVKTLDAIKLLAIDPSTGRMTVSAVCAQCAHQNTWENIKLFAANFIPCSHCGQKYNIPLPGELRANFENNMADLLGRFNKVAVWGVNYHSSDLFKHSRILHDPRVFPVDISGAKRMMDLYGKRIHPPSVIEEENISAVVIAIPVYFSQISSQVRSNHRMVTKIIDICRLVGPDRLGADTGTAL